ncbi:MAG: hypothetical protein IPJ30_12615 [Acidobacteria bacterium]|nr:hypothetical protein [Acidobacteriota bacterium]
MADLMIARLRSEEMNLPESTTLVGFRNYSALLLQTIIRKIPNFNYAVIEQGEESFVWQLRPELKRNLVIVLPITCTCSTYWKLRRFIKEYLESPQNEERYKETTVSNSFVNVFLILEETLKGKSDHPISIGRLKEPGGDNRLSDSERDKLYRMYAPFNWSELSSNRLSFGATDTRFTAFPLIQLFAKMHLPEECPLCFPEMNESPTGALRAERPLFPTYDNYETPNLIFGFPNFSGAENTEDFYDLFAPNDESGEIHLCGNIGVNGSTYSNYIRGGAFYRKNRVRILEFLERELNERLTPADERIVFITAKTMHDSDCLDELAVRDIFAGRSVSILRFQPSHEFIDNFVSIHREILADEDAKVIYFEEVLSAGKTFKLVSNYIKHLRDQNRDLIGIHGFDLVVTLVDRTLSFT